MAMVAGEEQVISENLATTSGDYLVALPSLTELGNPYTAVARTRPITTPLAGTAPFSGLANRQKGTLGLDLLLHCAMDHV